MSAVSALPQDIVNWLSKQGELSDITFMTEFPPRKKAIPLKKAIVAVGLKEVNVVDKFTENDEGVLEKNEYCRLAQMKIQLAIHVPFAYGGEKCHDIFTTIVDCLTFASDLNIVKSGCESMDSDRNTDALVINAWIDIEADFCPAVSTNLNYQSFLAKTHLCGSHITDSVIHVTAEDKERWNSQFITGYYIGSDTNTNTFNVGFKPKAVIVYTEEFPPVVTDFTKQKNYIYGAVATQDGASMGASVTSTGFKVYSSDYYGTDEGAPRLNKGGVRYTYIAFI